MVKRFFTVIIVLILGVSCSSSSDDSPEGGGKDNFDRGVVLINLADNIIIPSLQDLNSKLEDLNSKKDIFIATPNQENLDNLRTSWLAAYKVWQYVEMHNIGKAEEILYYFQMNIYPTNTADIEENISSGNYDLTHVNNNDAVGFPALDYMLYGLGVNDDAEILVKYTTNADAANYKTYLSDVVVQMKNLTETVLNDWTSSYRTTFIGSTSNTASSAYNKLVNDFIFYYEKGLRANKIGTPAGNFSTNPLPDRVEALYNKEASKVLALEALKATQDFFNGKKYNGNTEDKGYNSHLQSLNKENLGNLVNSQFNTARQKINDLEDSFYNQINTDNTKVTQAYDALQLNVVSLKVDMLQAFNISVDYVDADGD
ncbi:imelysin family protein [uncultured Maribacter sp.]|uniref:imelysin family protein n=1 Tax=uncultured Maribacter sp. TaxID=431308 RepID=UPI002615E75A|nr:imelysin family protein [uncultured Maribacter sp.]